MGEEEGRDVSALYVVFVFLQIRPPRTELKVQKKSADKMI
jgi:hypothetical protein